MVFGRGMIARYTPAVFAELWSERRKYETWLLVELAACEAMEQAKLVPSGTASSLRAKNVALDVERISAIERTTKHDVIAFLTHVEELAGPPARWLHRGMTSSDVLDTSFALLLAHATDLLLERGTGLLGALAKRARETAKIPMIGRSHGIFAEPVTFGLALASHYAEINRGIVNLKNARTTIAVGKIAGAVGTYAHLSPEIEANTLGLLGLAPETVSTQIVARDRHATWFSALALVAAGIERLATNVRHWQRSEVREAEEAFTVGQKGSSAMPHKRNPVLSENLCGLARVVRAAVTPALENVALWHERDISHSSVERMLAPDVSATLGFMLERATSLIEALVVYPDGLQKNLDSAAELYCSEGIMLALVETGMPRQEAYVLVQRNAMRTWRGEGSFQEFIVADVDIASRVDSAALRSLFNIDHMLRHVPSIVERALTF